MVHRVSSMRRAAIPLRYSVRRAARLVRPSRYSESYAFGMRVARCAVLEPMARAPSNCESMNAAPTHKLSCSACQGDRMESAPRNQCAICETAHSLTNVFPIRHNSSCELLSRLDRVGVGTSA
eukprot:6176293-Pleurochrysis_carterae.AAC.3